MCDCVTEQYNVDWGMWECEECGIEITEESEYEKKHEEEYESYEEDDDDEFDSDYTDEADYMDHKMRCPVCDNATNFLSIDCGIWKCMECGHEWEDDDWPDEDD